MPLVCVGLSHRTAPLAVREQMALGHAARHTVLSASWLRAAARTAGLGEVALLSTCHRTELYAAAPDPGLRFQTIPQGVGALLANACGVPHDFASPFLYARVSAGAVRHLCAVAAGLESVVIGESEVLGQVAEAHEESVKAGAAGPILDAAFRAAVRAGRRARAETGICRHPASVASEAVRLVQERRPGLASERLVVVGTGRMGRIAAERLHAAGATHVRVVGRTLQSARELAGPLGATPLPWHELAAAIHDADVVVASTAAPHPVITRELVLDALTGRAPERVLLLMDIAVPRDVESSVTELPGVEVLDLDHIQERVEAHREERAREVPRVEAIIEEEAALFEAWRHGAQLRPVLAGLHSRAEAIRREELERTLRRLGSLDPDTRRQIEALSHALVGKLLDAPSRRLRAATDPGQSEAWVDAMRVLFELPAEEGADEGIDDACPR
jgi:glutamyl-tRNA reductase